MGHVYLAHDPNLDRDVAIKVLPRELTADKERVSRFLREARLAARVRHPNTVEIHQVAVEAGLASIVMELVDGGSLEEIVAKRGAMPWREATRAIRDAAAGLGAAHEMGLVHRDVKPANLMRTCKGTVKVVDFGLVRTMQSPSQLTQPGMILGTPVYMAPEQWMGREADARSDLYALVCTYYYLLTAKEPFAADSIPALGYQHRHEPFPEAEKVVPDLPRAACRILARGSEKEPAQRFQSAAELIAALDKLLAMSPEALISDGTFDATTAAKSPEKRSIGKGWRSTATAAYQQARKNLSIRLLCLIGGSTLALIGLVLAFALGRFSIAKPAQALQLQPVPPQTVQAGTTLNVAVTAENAEAWKGSLRYSLDPNPPIGERNRLRDRTVHVDAAAGPGHGRV